MSVEIYNLPKCCGEIFKGVTMSTNETQGHPGSIIKFSFSHTCRTEDYIVQHVKDEIICLLHEKGKHALNIPLEIFLQKLETPVPGDSPIEKSFAKAWKDSHGWYPQSQIPIGPYIVDFLLGNLVVELDGHAWHSSREQRGRDAKRDIYLQKLGYQVARFTGSQINSDVRACVRECCELLNCHEQRTGAALPQ